MHWNELIHDMFKEESDFRSDCILHQEKLNRQGIIHLSIDERREIEYWLEKMAEEQEMVLDGMEFVKSACLQMILMFFQRLYNKKKKTAVPSKKKSARQFMTPLHIWSSIWKRNWILTHSLPEYTGAVNTSALYLKR